MLKSIFWKIINRLNYYITSPRMVLGYLRYDGTNLAKTRISNTVSIINPEKFMVADNVFIGHYNFIDASNSITLGEGCQVTNFISILTHSSHIAIRLYGKYYIENNGKHNAYIKGKVCIGSYTFIGPHSVIMPATTIGKGSLIAAYSLVSGEFPDFAVIAGNPAKVVGDTREIDQAYLNKYPELQDYYKQWAD